MQKLFKKLQSQNNFQELSSENLLDIFLQFKVKSIKAAEILRLFLQNFSLDIPRLFYELFCRNFEKNVNLISNKIQKSLNYLEEKI